MALTVCFTGHRDLDTDRAALDCRLDRAVEELIERGAVSFRAGGAVGFDTLAALAVLRARKKHPHIRLELFLPFPEQDRGWSREDRELFASILKAADAYRYLCTHYYNGAYHVRNRALVEGADVCVGYYLGGGGGTAYTVKLALRSGLEYVDLVE